MLDVVLLGGIEELIDRLARQIEGEELAQLFAEELRALEIHVVEVVEVIVHPRDELRARDGEVVEVDSVFPAEGRHSGVLVRIAARREAVRGQVRTEHDEQPGTVLLTQLPEGQQLPLGVGIQPLLPGDGEGADARLPQQLALARGEVDPDASAAVIGNGPFVEGVALGIALRIDADFDVLPDVSRRGDGLRLEQQQPVEELTVLHHQIERIGQALDGVFDEGEDAQLRLDVLLGRGQRVGIEHEHDDLRRVGGEELPGDGDGAGQTHRADAHVKRREPRLFGEHLRVDVVGDDGGADQRHVDVVPLGHFQHHVVGMGIRLQQQAVGGEDEQRRDDEERDQTEPSAALIRLLW